VALNYCWFALPALLYGLYKPIFPKLDQLETANNEEAI